LSDRLSKLREDIERDVSEYLQAVELLLPSFDASIAIGTMEFYEASIRPRSIATALLLWWTAIALEKSDGIGISPAARIMYAESLDALEKLCATTSIKYAQEDQRPQIFKTTRKSSDAFPKAYPNHSTLISSLEKIADVLRQSHGLPSDLEASHRSIDETKAKGDAGTAAPSGGARHSPIFP
jgi:hypothetical protein